MKVHLMTPRFRIFAIVSTWIVASIQNSLILYLLHLEQNHGDIFCMSLEDPPFSYVIYKRVYTALFHILPLVAMAIFYCVIAATLRRQDKALQCRAVHQKDQRKWRAIKMS